MTIPNVTIDDVIRHLTQLRATLVHALKQPDISVRRFNEIRDQLLPLDQQLRNLGHDPEPTPQMNPNYRPGLTRAQRRHRHRASKHSSYEQRIKCKLATVRGDE